MGLKVGENVFDRVAKTFFSEPKPQDFVPFTYED